MAKSTAYDKNYRKHCLLRDMSHDYCGVRMEFWNDQQNIRLNYVYAYKKNVCCT